MDGWETKGCSVCRQQWMSGSFPPRIAVNRERHSFLHGCPICNTLWEQYERYATDISRDAAIALYGEPARRGTSS